MIFKNRREQWKWNLAFQPGTDQYKKKKSSRNFKKSKLWQRDQLNLFIYILIKFKTHVKKIFNKVILKCSIGGINTRMNTVEENINKLEYSN